MNAIHGSMELNVKHEMARVQQFSAALLALGKVMHASVPERMLYEAAQALRKLVPFRSAWWGMCSDAQHGDPPRNWLHGRINLSPDFAHEWNQLSQLDVFARASMRDLGVVARFSGHADPAPEVEAFSRRHALFHSMAITVELPGSGLLFFISLYRGEQAPTFSDDDSVLLAEYSAHLLQHWLLRVREMLLSKTSISAESHALADLNGNLLYLGRRLGQLLHAAHPRWQGSVLPAALAPLLSGAPCVFALGRHKLGVQRCGGLVTIEIEGPRRTLGLPLREHNAAVLYAQGHSYKEIARLLKLSPATVRSYLRNAYLHLGVHNKIELGHALVPSSPPPLRHRQA